MRRIVAILNPKSDRGRAAALAASLRGALGGRFEVELCQTSAGGEGVRLAREAGERSCDAVLAVGGDGTVHEVVNGLMALPQDARPPLGIIPAGSGNDVAYALGIDKDLQRLAELVERAQTRSVDVASVRSGAGRFAFAINNVGLLLEGVINHLSHSYHWPRGSGLYVRAMLRTLLRPIPAAELSLLVDGVEQRRQAILLSIANGPRSGGKFLLMPEADPCDGRLNYVAAAPVGRLQLLGKAARALQGRELHDAWIERGEFSQMRIRSNIPLAAHVDGEPWLAIEEQCREMEIAVIPGAMKAICDGR